MPLPLRLRDLLLLPLRLRPATTSSSAGDRSSENDPELPPPPVFTSTGRRRGSDLLPAAAAAARLSPLPPPPPLRLRCAESAPPARRSPPLASAAPSKPPFGLSMLLGMAFVLPPPPAVVPGGTVGGAPDPGPPAPPPAAATAASRSASWRLSRRSRDLASPARRFRASSFRSAWVKVSLNLSFFDRACVRAGVSGDFHWAFRCVKPKSEAQEEEEDTQHGPLRRQKGQGVTVRLPWLRRRQNSMLSTKESTKIARKINVAGEQGR